MAGCPRRPWLAAEVDSPARCVTLEGVYLLRLMLPDRPGSLGSVATAMGAVDADIAAVSVVEKRDGEAVDDFMLELPADTPPDALVTACVQLPGVEVLWLSNYPESWGLQADVDVLAEMTADPAHAPAILTKAAPEVFHASWAALVEQAGPRVLASSELAPDFDEDAMRALGPLGTPGSRELRDGWLHGWPASLIAIAPLAGGRSLVIARHGGPDFLDSEIARMRHLAALAG